MERKYWLQRKRSHAVSARAAATSESRLIHLDLAGRYSVKAAAASGGLAQNAFHSGTRPPVRPGGAAGEPLPDAPNYEHLEIGARWLASRTGDEGERQTHIRMANKYARLRLDSLSPGSR